MVFLTDKLRVTISTLVEKSNLTDLPIYFYLEGIKFLPISRIGDSTLFLTSAIGMCAEFCMEMLFPNSLQ